MAERKTAPVILFTYNRPEHTRRTIEALAKNELAQDTELFVFSDAAKKRWRTRNRSSLRASLLMWRETSGASKTSPGMS